MAKDQNGRLAGVIKPEVDKVREQGAANFRTTLIIELATILLPGSRQPKQLFNALNKFKPRYQRRFGATRYLRELRAQFIFYATRINRHTTL
jgi:hypothetical protein